MWLQLPWEDKRSRTALEKEAPFGQQSVCSLGKEEEIALDLLPFSGAPDNGEEMSVSGSAFLFCFLSGMERSDRHLQRFSRA